MFTFWYLVLPSTYFLYLHILYKINKFGSHVVIAVNSRGVFFLRVSRLLTLYICKVPFFLLPIYPSQNPHTMHLLLQSQMLLVLDYTQLQPCLSPTNLDTASSTIIIE